MFAPIGDADIVQQRRDGVPDYDAVVSRDPPSQSVGFGDARIVDRACVAVTDRMSTREE